MVDVDLNWLSCFHFFIFLTGPLVIDCMIFVSPFLPVKRISMSTVSLFVQLKSGIF